jgi:uncharacterized protein (DUF849 family)
MTLTLKTLACCAALATAVTVMPRARADMVLGCQETGPATITTCSATANVPPNPGSGLSVVGWTRRRRLRA